MTDFMRWLYAGYIKPQLEERDVTGYETSLSLMDTTLSEGLKKEYARAVEFYAGNAFLLGLRTGAGLSEALKTPSNVLF